MIKKEITQLPNNVVIKENCANFIYGKAGEDLTTEVMTLVASLYTDIAARVGDEKVKLYYVTTDANDSDACMSIILTAQNMKQKIGRDIDWNIEYMEVPADVKGQMPVAMTFYLGLIASKKKESSIVVFDSEIVGRMDKTSFMNDISLCMEIMQGEQCDDHTTIVAAVQSPRETTPDGARLSFDNLFNEFFGNALNN